MTISYEAIQQKAFEIWQREGQPEGRDLEHWLQAEKELRGEKQSNKTGQREKAGKAGTQRQ